MVPRKAQSNGESRNDAVSLASKEDDSESISSTSEPTPLAINDQDGEEREYHTENEDGNEDRDEDEYGSLSESHTTNNVAALLPQELLKSLPSSAHSLQPANIPWEEMTRQQRVAQRNRNRKSKKRMLDKLRQNTKGTGVLEAGKVAQLKRLVVPRKEKVIGGRVGKRTKAEPQLSGRQQLLELRKRDIEQNERQLLPGDVKKRRRRIKRASAG